MLYRYLGLLGSNPPVSFMTGDLLIYPTLVALVVVAAYCVWKRIPGGRTFLAMCFVVYASMVLEVTLFPIPTSFAEIARFRIDPSLYVAPDLNLAPFRSIMASVRGIGMLGTSVFVRNWLGNLLLLLPLGVMAPLLWSRFRRAPQAIGLFIAVSLSIELAQFIGSFLVFRIRWKSADIDDLIVNVVGALLGFLVAKMLIWVGQMRHNPKRE